jgi:hypothetical protein
LLYAPGIPNRKKTHEPVIVRGQAEDTFRNDSSVRATSGSHSNPRDREQGDSSSEGDQVFGGFHFLF